MKATLATYNQTPRKVKLVTDLVKGKTVKKALEELSFLPKRAAGPIAKLIKSAADNAKAGGVSGDDLKVKNIIVENAGVYVRYMPRAYGRASAIRRRRSRVKVELSEGAKKKAKTATP